MIKNNNRFISIFLFCISLVTLSVGQAQVVGPGDWTSLRLYGHAFNVQGFSEAEYNWIENHNYLFTVEKRNEFQILGQPTSELASGLASDQINENNPESKVFFYWNASKPHLDNYATSAKVAEENPDWVTYGDIDRWAWEDDAFTTWWADVVIDQINNTSHEGTFIDLVATVHAGHGTTGLAKIESAMDRMRANTDGLIIHSAFWPLGDNGDFLAGARTVDHSDGVFVESFFHYLCDNAVEGKAMLDALLAVPSDKYIITNTKNDGVWGDNHEFSMAAHLIIANDNSFHRYYHDGYSSTDLQIWHEDFGRYIGKPEGVATVDGYVYTRTFENAVVTVDVENRTSSIVWGDITNPFKLPSNLALGGTASQSSTNNGGDASRAIDGNTNGQFGLGSVTHTSSENHPWWQVDLGEESTLGDIVIYNRIDDCCISRLADFTVYVLDDEGNITFEESFDTYPDPSLTVNAEGALGSVVKIEANGVSALTLAEVEIYNLYKVRIEAEDYDAMSGIITEVAGDIDGAFNVGSIAVGDFMEYEIEVPVDGVYEVSYRVASPNENGEISLQVDGETKTTTEIGATGGWQEYETVTTTVTLAEGKQTLKLLASEAGWNINWIEISYKEKGTVTGIESSLIADELMIFPNPVTDKVSVQLKSSEQFTLELMNNLGTVIYESEVSGNTKSEIDMSSFSSGVYFVKISNTEGSSTQKIIKE